MSKFSQETCIMVSGRSLFSLQCFCESKCLVYENHYVLDRSGPLGSIWAEASFTTIIIKPLLILLYFEWIDQPKMKIHSRSCHSRAVWLSFFWDVQLLFSIRWMWKQTQQFIWVLCYIPSKYNPQNNNSLKLFEISFTLVFEPLFI